MPWKSFPTPWPQKVLLTEKGGVKFEATLVMMEPMSRYSAPGLTTCQMAVYEKGRVPWRMACFKHSREQSTNARPTSSTFPTR